MLSIVCPQCGMTTYHDDIGFPQCRHCDEDLLRCNACRHGAGGGCRSARHAAQYREDGEAAKQCRGFSPVRGEPRSRLAWEIPAPVWVSVLLVTILAAIMAAGWFLDPAMRYFRGQPLRLQTIVPAQAEVNHPFDVIMWVNNPLDNASTRFYVEIDEQFFHSVRPMDPDPRPARVGRFHNNVILEYDPLIKNGQQVLRFPFVPFKPGTARFVARIYSPSNQLINRIDLPITVNAPGVAGIRREGEPL